VPLHYRYTLCVILIVSQALWAKPACVGGTVLLHAGSTREALTKSLTEQRALGLTHVLFQVFEYQTHGRSVVIAPIPEKSAPLLLVEQILEEANGLGFKTLLSPIVLLERPLSHEWRGNIRPVDALVWEQNYREMLFKYARIAQTQGVETLILGSELASMESQLGFWRYPYCL